MLSHHRTNLWLIYQLPVLRLNTKRWSCSTESKVSIFVYMKLFDGQEEVVRKVTHVSGKCSLATAVPHRQQEVTVFLAICFDNKKKGKAKTLFLCLNFGN